jgi:Mg-chelatase subunit ChlD
MPNRHAIVTYGVTTAAAATITVAALLQPWRGARPPAPPPPAPAQAKRAVDVVFAVDTTGSMGGLIEGAKRTVWSIATHIRKTEPNADLRIGLVAYRDIGDDYVTRDFALTSDLDAVFAELSGYRAAGGGDTPEDVDAALDDVVHKMAWRDDAKKLVFLVGDAPPASRGDVPRFDVLAREAGERQIVLNTIRCGFDPLTQSAWQQIAALGNGEYSTIEQNGGVQQIATPYDAKLSEISARIDRTAVIVGDDAERLRHEHAMAAAVAAPEPAKADRAAYYAAEPTGGAGRASSDLVGGVASGKMSIEATPQAALPPPMRAMAKPALKAEIARLAKARKEAQEELKAVAEQREEYLKTQAKGEGFDDKVKDAVSKQLK